METVLDYAMAKATPKGRVEFKAPATWISRAEKAAESLGLSLSAYIRLLVTQDMERLEQSRSNDRRKG